MRLLVVEDEATQRRMLVEYLAQCGHDVGEAAAAEEALAEIERTAPDLVLTDVRLPGTDGVELIRRARTRGAGAEFLVVTAFGTIENAVEAMRAGAHDYLTKPIDLRDLDRAIQELGTRVAPAPPPAPDDPFAGLGHAMTALAALADRVARTNATVLVTGETGVGKEIVADRVHARSRRAKGPLVKLNCAALAESLLEAELFGHEKGAFTGADRLRPGLFEAARGGTVFLDEIGDMPPSLQVRLLRVLQAREVLRVGGRKAVVVDFRLIAATHRDLPALVAAGRFREDLLFRLRVVELRVPPLRERREDIPALAERLLRRHAARNAVPFRPLSPPADARRPLARPLLFLPRRQRKTHETNDETSPRARRGAALLALSGHGPGRRGRRRRPEAPVGQRRPRGWRRRGQRRIRRHAQRRRHRRRHRCAAVRRRRFARGWARRRQRARGRARRAEQRARRRDRGRGRGSHAGRRGRRVLHVGLRRVLGRAMSRLVLLLAILGVPAQAGTPDLPERVREAEGCLRAGQQTKALEILAEVVQANPDALDAHELYQDVMRAAGKDGEILETYRGRFQAAPEDVSSRYLLARLLEGPRALTELRAVVTAEPGFARGWVAYARALRRAGKAKQAEAAARKATELEPGLATAHETLGWAVEHEGRLEEAEASYRRALELDDQRLTVRYKLAHLLARTGRSGEAMSQIAEAQRISPKEPRVLVNRGLVLGVLKRPKEAAEAFAEAARSAPDDPLLQVLLADSYAEVGEWELALAAASRALSLDPKLAAAHAARAYVALRQGNTEAAAASYREAARLDPKNARHAYFLGRVHEKGNDLKQAERQYRTALAKDPDNVTYMLALGGVLVRRGQGKQALTIYKGAAKAAPDDEDVWIRYGHTAADEGKPEDAAKAFERALILEPDNPATLLSLGIVYEVGLRDREKAIETYRAYLAAGGKDTRVKRWLAALEAKK